jgi:ferric-dicitrate binding protein FerR (iron transport regulator)
MSVCPRLFEAEAMRDGRLTGAEVARFQTHLTLCPACEREVRQLQALAAALRGLERDDTPQAETDELGVRRRRTQLLAAFDANLVPAPRGRLRRFTPALAVALGTLGALGGLAIAVVPWQSPAKLGSTSTAPVPLDPVGVHPDGNATWSRQVEHQLERITLESGTLAIRVDHAHSGRRLLVLLPDGELEDIGTAFTVSVDAGRTARITVQEGSVILRLRGKVPLVLRAGEVWAHDSVPPVPSVPPAASSAPPALSAMPRATPSALVRGQAALGARAAAPPPPSGSAASASAPDPAADFRAALSALNDGDRIGAAAGFAAFLADHPRDPRAEDAAYLRVIALQRAGDTPAMRRAADDYLRRYPRGFRRAEVEQLAE